MGAFLLAIGFIGLIAFLEECCDVRQYRRAEW
jgi:hypothetical protein